MKTLEVQTCHESKTVNTSLSTDSPLTSTYSQYSTGFSTFPWLIFVLQYPGKYFHTESVEELESVLNQIGETARVTRQEHRKKYVCDAG